MRRRAGTGATAVASVNAQGAITAINVTDQGNGYTCAPDVRIDTTYGSGAAAHATFTSSVGFITGISLTNGGTDYFAPVVTISGDGTGATADATIDPYTGAITGITVTNPGTGYHSATISITDDGGTGSGATATATLSHGVIAVVVDAPGSGYRTPGGIRKFVNRLPGLGPSGVNDLGQYISVAHPDTVTYPGADYYEIGLVEYTKKLHSDLPATKLRGYIQLNNGTDPNCAANNATCNIIPPDDLPQYLGATIIARKNRPVRILFKNMLQTGLGGNLFLPVDTTMMGAGMGPGMSGDMPVDNQNSVFDGVRNPMCTMPGVKNRECYTENRATLHLHGGTTPWISDGTPHQWTVPANEGTNYPKGVSVSYVPDMWYDSATGATITSCAGQTSCAVAGATNNPGAGALTFYYTNQQSARLLFYHDHAWGITRLNVYAGEAAGYLITDDTEQKLIAANGPLDAADPALGLGIPLIIQDRTFVPSASQLATQDPTWDATRWGNTGNFWYHHVYMPAQNPSDPTGVSPYGRWMYGPWFWPPATLATTPYQPIPNPYYVAGCDPATAPNGFCEPPLIPGTPNISVGMEQFNDTPMVNGTVYPTVTVEPKAYRFRLLNAANDRFFNLQWYVADSTGTEVALKASEVAAAQLDPNVFPTPDTSISPAGPNWLQIGSEGGFLPTPVVVPNQPITWITDPTRFDVGNVDQHSMLLAPAERTDVVVDFSKYAGKTLILYNDAPAAFPARVASYDYYTGDPDNTDIGGAPSTVPGFGPNTRTIMQVKVAGAVTSPSLFSLSKLVSAFTHKADNSGVFESGQHPIIVGQAGYNRAYGKSFTTAGDCSNPASTIKCDGFARINQQGGEPFTFDTLSGNKISILLQPKALHDEMNSSSFDEYGRMTANIGLEAVPANPGAQNVVLYPYVNPATEVIDGTKLQSAASVQVTPIATADDGTQIWKITHNGVDTHPIHFHLFDVQVINRVTWDNIIIPPDLTELGWKDTVRISPLEDTYVALRPVVPSVPFEVPNSIRPLNPMMPIGSMMGLSSIGPNGQATNSTVVNEIVNFGWEYVWHCHILSHEEMDMMRPMSLALPPSAPSNLVANSAGNAVNLTWTNNSKSATSFTVQRAQNATFTQDLVTLPAVYDTNATDTSASGGTRYYYRVYASNTVGATQSSNFKTSPGGDSFPTLTVNSGMSNVAEVSYPPNASVNPTSLTFANQLILTTSSAQVITLSNTGLGNLNVAGISITGTNAAEFAQTNNCTPTVSAQQNCSISVSFAPLTRGAKTATLTITSNDPTNPVINIPLAGTGYAIFTVSPASLTFPLTTVGYGSGVQIVTVVNTSSSPITLATSISGSGFSISGNNCNVAVAPNNSCRILVNYIATAGGTQTGQLTLSAGGMVQNVSLTGTGDAIIQVSPTSLTYAATNIAAGAGAQKIGITNRTGTGITIGTSIATSIPGTFVISTNGCGGTLAPNAGCYIYVNYVATYPGQQTGTLTITPSTGAPVAVSLTGTGNPGDIVVNTTTLTFATTKVGTTTGWQWVPVLNRTGMTITVTPSATAGFSTGAGCTLAPNTSCNIAVNYKATAVGQQTGTLTITPSAGNVHTVSLIGTGN